MKFYKTDVLVFSEGGQRFYVEAPFEIFKLADLFNAGKPPGAYHPEVFIQWLVDQNYLSPALDDTIHVTAGVTDDLEPWFEMKNSDAAMNELRKSLDDYKEKLIQVLAVPGNLTY